MTTLMKTGSALNRPQVILRAASALAAVVGIVALVLIGGAAAVSTSYDLKLTMADADGLRPGSQVLLGGVPVGTVNTVYIGAADRVIVDLHLSSHAVHVGRGAKADITAANLLGDEYVSLNPGNRNEPLRSGSTLALSATTAPTDLDQIVDVMDGSTRARLAILIDEAGLAVGGREGDVSAILKQIPISLTTATGLLNSLVQSNDTLGSLVSHGDQFVSRIDRDGPAVQAAIDSAAGAARTLALRAGQLSQTVVGAPKALETLQNFLRRVGATATQLTPATTEIAHAAGPIDDVLTSLRPFTKSAVPTLNRAAAVAPLLTRLATRATPTVKAAVPTLTSLDTIAQDAKPLTAWLGLSSADLFNITSGWPAAIALRDGIGHIFNGDVILNPRIVLNAANTGATADQRCTNLLDVKSPDLLRAMNELTAAATARAAGCAGTSHKVKHPGLGTGLTHVTAPVVAPVQKVTGTVGSAVGTVLGGVNKVLNGTTSTVAGTVQHTQTTASQTASSLGSLLNYLTGK